MKEKLDTQYEYQSIEWGCSHNGEHKSTSKGVRPKQRVYAAGCNFAVRVALRILDKVSKQHKYVIVKSIPTHNGHIVSEDAIKTYQVKKYVTLTYIAWI